MKRKLRFLTALALVLALLAGCSGGKTLGEKVAELQSQREGSGPRVTNETLVYERPDGEELERLLDAACEASENGTAEEILDAVWEYYDAYDWFYTYYALADIRYSADLTDPYWEEEYSFCAEMATEVDEGLERLNRTLAKSPRREELEAEFFGEGFFEDYDGESLWDAEFTWLLEEETRLQNRFYELFAEENGEPGTRAWYDACADDRAQVLVDLIGVRQQMADHWGYDTYAEFAWDFYYYRDYTPEQASAYYDRIRQELVPLYRESADSDAWDEIYRSAKSDATFAYVRDTSKAMGGTVWEAFCLLEEGQLYDIAPGENKYTTSFEVYLTSYGVPFLFMCPDGTRYDYLTFAHEFGHFCSDYAAGGSYAGVDVSEVFSQGMEYLSLCYGGSEALSRAKLADSLATYVEQAAFGSFEQRMYELEGEELSVEGLYALYEEVALEFGFDAVGYDRREFVEVNHYYTNPMYIVSYVVSNDAAMQLYQRELEERGAGVELLEKNLATEEGYFLAFVDAAGLESPFAPGRLESVRELFMEADV